MPGLVGCVSNNFLDTELLSAMVKPMLHRSTYRVHPHTEEKCIMAAVDLEQEHGLGEYGRDAVRSRGVVTVWPGVCLTSP